MCVGTRALEDRIQALEARVAELVQVLNNIAPIAIEGNAKASALFTIWQAQADTLPGEERPSQRGWLNS